MNAFAQDFKLGVLGGGQLGRMMIQSAIDYNLDIHVLDPDANAPCKDLAPVVYGIVVQQIADREIGSQVLT
ncbi:MAG: hypothetical protein AAFQ98_22015, partial [Bacteroidota bacterium]